MWKLHHRQIDDRCESLFHELWHVYQRECRFQPGWCCDPLLPYAALNCSWNSERIEPECWFCWDNHPRPSEIFQSICQIQMGPKATDRRTQATANWYPSVSCHSVSKRTKWISESYYYLWWNMGSSLYTRKQAVVNTVEARVFAKTQDIQDAAICRQDLWLVFLEHPGSRLSCPAVQT